MIVNSVKFLNTITLPSKDNSNTAMVTKWDVKFGASLRHPMGKTKSYHVVILKEQKSAGWLGRTGPSTSAYVTNKITAKNDLSKSTLHVKADSDMEVLNDHMGTPICSFDRTKDSVDLGFTIDAPEFDRVNAISEGLITKLGDFLNTHLNKSSPVEEKEEEKEAPAAGGEKAPAATADAAPVVAADAAPVEADDKKAPAAGDGPPPAKPKGWLRSGVSALSTGAAALGPKAKAQATCNRVGFLVMTLAAATFALYLGQE